MSRLSREHKRGRSAAEAAAKGAEGSGVTPIEVHVPAESDGVPSAGATVGGMPVVAGPGQTLHEAVLNYLHRLALATGHPVLATVHDERIGFVVPIRVLVDGASEFVGEPVRVDPPATPAAGPGGQDPGRRPEPAASVPEQAPAVEPQRPRRDKPTHVLRAVEERTPAGSAPTFPLRAVPKSEAGPQLRPENRPAPPPSPAPTPPAHVLRPAPEPTAAGPLPPRHPVPVQEPGVVGQPAPVEEPGVVGQPAAVQERGPVEWSATGSAPAGQRAVPVSQAESVGRRPMAAGPVPAREPGPVGHPTPAAPRHPAPVQEPAADRQAESVQRPVTVQESAEAPPEPAVAGPSAVPLAWEPVQESAGARSPAPVAGPVPVHEREMVPQPQPGAPDAQAQSVRQSAVDPAPSSAEQPARPPARPGGTVATFVLRAVPEQAPLISATSGPAQALPGEGTPAGTVSRPTGVFGPPPVTAPAEPEPAPTWRAPETGPDEPKTLRPDFDPDPDPDSYSAPEWRPTPAPRTVPVAGVEEEVKEPPVREFDSVAEAVLAPESGAVPPGGTGGPIAEPMARINAAVKQGRIEEAAGLAEQTVAEATAALGAEHPDVLRLRELTAYIAYLAGDALRSFHLSLDLARLRHRLRDARGAYGNVQSAAAAWRAVRDPIQGLHLGRDLIAVWSELAVGEGPAADDLDQLERARSRMGRLAERARNAAGERPHVQ